MKLNRGATVLLGPVTLAVGLILLIYGPTSVTVCPSHKVGIGLWTALQCLKDLDAMFVGQRL